AKRFDANSANDTNKTTFATIGAKASTSRYQACGGGVAAGLVPIFNTSARISLPGLNLTTERSGIGTSVSGALGLRPIRALRTLSSNTPKLRSSTLSPLANASEI